DLYVVRSVQDMEVRQDVAVGGDDNARSQRPLFETPRRARATRPWSELITEKPAQEIVVGRLEPGRRHPRLSLRANGDHCRRNDVDDSGVRVAASRNGV